MGEGKREAYENESARPEDAVLATLQRAYAQPFQMDSICHLAPSAYTDRGSHVVISFSGSINFQTSSVRRHAFAAAVRASAEGFGDGAEEAGSV